jgi:farnesol kinase
MCYFHLFGFVEQTWIMVAAFGITSLAAAIVESLPVSTRLDDNLTAPIASLLVGGLVFYYIGGGGGATGGDRSSIFAMADMVFAGSS